MNKDNTYGNKYWEPEYQQQMQQLRQQQQEANDLDQIEEIQDNIRYYDPYKMGFTEA
jgi:hypothetical protein